MSLWRYAALRIVQSLPLILGIIVINFLLINLAPGDPVTALIGDFPAPAEYIETVREQFGLDQSLGVRLLTYIGNVLQGELGFSFNYRVPVLELVLGRLGRTLVLMITTIVFATESGKTRRWTSLRSLSRPSATLFRYSGPASFLFSCLL